MMDEWEMVGALFVGIVAALLLWELLL